MHGRPSKLPVQRTAVGDATTHELRPRWDGDLRIDALGEQVPQLRVMPAQFMARTVAMRADALAEPPYLREERGPVHHVEVVVHTGQASDDQEGQDGVGRPG